MTTRYPFNIDVTTKEGQVEVLRLWSSAEIDASSARLILRVTEAKLQGLARAHDILPPSNEAVERSVRALEARVRPQLRKAKRDKVENELTDIWRLISGALDGLASVALESRAYGQSVARQSYSVAHARLRKALDNITSVKEIFEEGRLLEAEGESDFEYSNANLSILRSLDRPVPRPDYYLIGDFNHVGPVTDHDVLWCWSRGFLTTETASDMIDLGEGDTISEIALQLGVPLPLEEAVTPAEAAAILGDEPVNGDITFNVRRRIRDGRLPSYFRSDVEARRMFEDEHRRR